VLILLVVWRGMSQFLVWLNLAHPVPVVGHAVYSGAWETTARLLGDPDSHPRVANEYSESCPTPWPAASFNLLTQFVLKEATLVDLSSEGAPVSAEFREEWRRLFDKDGEYRLPARSRCKDRVELTTEVVLKLEDLARSLNVPDDMPVQMRAHKVGPCFSAVPLWCNVDTQTGTDC
jgi:hypothetical protein